jgi:hypothetical protein
VDDALGMGAAQHRQVVAVPRRSHT